MDPVFRSVHSKCDLLRSSGRTLEDICRISFDDPDKIFAEYCEGGEFVGMTYGEFDLLCKKAASTLFDKAGSGRFVGLYSENSVQWTALFWAILRSGNKPYLINLVQPRNGIEHTLSALGCDTLVYYGKAPGLCKNELSYDELIIEEPRFAAETSFGNELAITTSGTTLREKICIYTGREISEQILNSEEVFLTNSGIMKGCRGTVRMLMLMPLYHIFGLEASFLWFLMYGVTFVFPPEKDPASILRTIRERRVTHVFAVPLFWRAVEKTLMRDLGSYSESERNAFSDNLTRSLKLQAENPRKGLAYAKKAFLDQRSELMGESVNFCISGGSRLNDRTLELINALGYPLFCGYGMSEIGIGSVELSDNASDRVKNSVGKPFSSINYRLDADGRLFVSGASLCGRLIVDGSDVPRTEWFDTGDIMSCDEDGRYYYKGRVSELVFGEAGEKLNPDIAERAFELTNAEAFSVLGDKDNENLIMVVQIRDDLVDVQKRKLQADITAGNASLPIAYRVKKVCYTYDSICASGIKLSRAQLRRSIDEGGVRLFELTNDHTDCGNESEVKGIVRELMAEELGIEADSIQGNAHFFYDLGGSSLDYLSLISAIDRRFDITMKYEGEDFGYSLDELARMVEERICL